ncbi:phosphatase PAP2 family protein [Sphingomonas profundi]|uniref:phosphatase PAP2 family protein n=1 Tax=Alterirhizorhabdus profundi TaxID=2681549 RepID=UPI0012E9439D|nr:phosphatase PAP2 family protein [Sphingomonas profundi]
MGAVAIGLAVHAGWTEAFDRALLFAFAPPAGLVAFVQMVTWLGNATTRIAVAALVALWLLMARDLRRALVLGGVVAGGMILNTACKLIVLRPRPDLLARLDHVTTSSFPSGHAANATILYVALAWLAPERHRSAALAAALVLAAAIGLSRIALAVHWPSDVAAGWCLGLAWAIAWRRPLAAGAAG